MGNIVHRGKGSFTHVENTIFFDHGLSAKAKGIYCQIRSLENNSEWVFSVKGFASLLRDGVDSVAAGLKELEAAGYIIRARKRGENGRFLKAEEATWITLDDPAMHTSVTDELKAEGYTVLSEFKRDPGNDAKFELENALPAMDKTEPPNTKVSTRTGKSRSGKSRSGKSVTINNLSYKELIESSPSLVPPEDMPGERGKGKGEGDYTQFEKGEFPKAFEHLCAMSIKPVSSLKFKRDAHAAWRRRLAEGYEERQILDAYATYAERYRMRNGDDAHLAKNLIRWLEADGGLEEFAEKPFPPDLFAMPGEPLSMEELAEHDGEFGRLWRKVVTQRDVRRSWLLAEGHRPSEAEVRESCEEDDYYRRLLAEAQKRYDRYLRMLELRRNRRE